MRILLLTDHYLPGLGGIETHVAALAARQVERGDDVSVLTTTPASADGRHCDDNGPVKVRRVRSVFEGALVDFRSYDIVHTHVSVIAPFSAPLAALAASQGVPTVVTVHSLWNKMGSVAAAAASVAGLRRAPVVWTAVSRAAAEQLSMRLPGDLDVHVIPNAVEVVPRARLTHRQRDEPVRLVTTMRIARRKRPLQLLDMFQALECSASTPVTLTIIGDGPLRQRAEHRVRRTSLRDSVTVTGRLEPAEVLSTLTDSDLYVAPAVLESFGLAAMEARSVGLPVVGRTGNGMADFIRDGYEGWLCSSDADMVDRLRDLVDDADLRSAVSEHNRSTPSPVTWARSMDQHDATYALAGSRVRVRQRRPLRLLAGG